MRQWIIFVWKVHSALLAYSKSYAVEIYIYISTAENAYRLCADLVMLLWFLLLLFYIELIALGAAEKLGGAK